METQRNKQQAVAYLLLEKETIFAVKTMRVGVGEKPSAITMSTFCGSLPLFLQLPDGTACSYSLFYLQWPFKSLSKKVKVPYTFNPSTLEAETGGGV